MLKHKQGQAIAIADAARRAGDIAATAFPSRAVVALEKEAARIVAEDEAKRANGGTGLHIVSSGGMLSGFIKDANTTVRFAGGTVAVTTHD